jgi:3',5'-cyclic AMP phosphodiesterase CpdA
VQLRIIFDNVYRLIGTALLLAALTTLSPAESRVVLRVAQISDTHLGEHHSPNAASNLQRAVALANAQHPDVFIVTGDIGENPAAWDAARRTLHDATAPVYFVPGNHDVHTTDLDRYRASFGSDYYTFRVKKVTFVVINSQLLGNYDQFSASSPQPLPPGTERESARMLAWMRSQIKKLRRRDIVIGVQHIPAYRSPGFPDAKPYWVISEPYRSRELELLRAMKIRHVLAGHWHMGQLFDAGGITWHIGPASSWLPWKGELGFAMHTVFADGDVQTEFLTLDGSTSLARNLGQSPESLCTPEPPRSVRICEPAESPVSSPFRVLAVARGEPLVKVIQIYVDGEKKYETAGDIMNTDLTLPSGKHEFIVQGLDDSGFFRSRMFITVR